MDLERIMANILKEMKGSNDYGFYSDPQSVYGRACIQYYGEYNKVYSLRIKQKYEKNYSNFRTNVNAIVQANTKNNLIEPDEYENSAEILLTQDEWKKAKLNLSQSSRQKFKAYFTHFLTRKIQNELKLNCYLNCSYNWVNADKNGWKGLYICQECQTRFLAQILSFSTDSITIRLFWNGRINHEKIKKSAQCRGDQRKSLSIQIAADGVSNFITEKILNTKNNEDPLENITSINENVAYKLKSQYVNKNKISNDISIDCKVTKQLFDSLCKSKNLSGYLQYIALNPFGLILMTEVQIRMWFEVQKQNPIWYIDSTGSIMRKIDRQSIPFLYSIVWHDVKTKAIVSLADFITTSQSSMNICKYLFTIKSILLTTVNMRQKYKVAPIMVTDFSWALLNAICHTFNNCTILEYLNKSFEVLVNGEDINNIEINARLYICAIHYLKIIIRKTKTMSLIPVNIRNTFLFIFTLLQNSTTIHQFENYLFHAYTVLMQPKMNASVYTSLSVLKLEISNRNLQNDIDLDNSKEGVQDYIKFSNENNNLVDNIKKESPFTSHFERKLQKFANHISNKSYYNLSSDQKNVLFYPELMNVIIQRLYNMPMWTGVYIAGILESNNYKVKSRLNNNNVENYFKILKHNLLRKTQNMPSEISILLYKRIMSKYHEYYEDSINVNFNEKDLLNSKEEWRDSSAKSKKRTPVYYENNDNFANFVENINDKMYPLKNINKFKAAFQLADLDISNVEMTEIESSDMINEPESMQIDNSDSVSLVDIKRRLNNVNPSYESIDEMFEFFQSNLDVDVLFISAIFAKKRSQLLEFVNCLRSAIQHKQIIYSTERICYEYMDYFRNEKVFENCFVPVFTVGDGNCLFYAVSQYVFGTNKYYKHLKIGVAFILFEYQDLFNTIISDTKMTNSFKTHILIALMDFKWDLIMYTNKAFVCFQSSDTLLNRCLDVITRSFNKYNLKTFELLPKTIRRRLFQILSRRSLINDDNIEYFVDEETKEIDFRDCPNISDVALSKLNKCKYLWKVDLTSISGERCNITSKGIESLTLSCPNIRVLLLPKCINIDDECLLLIAKTFGERLVQLSVSHSSLITDQGLGYVGNHCKVLRAIDLGFTQITDLGIFNLMTNQVSATIEEIHIGNLKFITDESIESILLNSKRVKFLLFHDCPKLTNASRLALDDYMKNTSNAKMKHLTWTVTMN